MAVYGGYTIPLSITTDGEFSSTTEVERFLRTFIDTTLELTEVYPLLAYDSWLTIGYEDHYENG